MTKKNMDKLFEKSSMQLLLMVLEYFLLVLVTYTGLQLIRIKNCFGVVNAISFAVPLVYFLISEKNKNKKLFNKIIIMGLYLVIVLGLPFISGKTYDLTIDGNSYHKTAIAFLKNGWNPFYEKSLDFQKNNDDVIQFEEDSKVDIWIEHYPKASWILAANYYNFTNNIESGKCITIILLMMMGIASFNVISLFLNKKISFIISMLLALNPVILCQLFNYYIDGIMGMCFLMELLFLFLIDFKEKQSIDLWICLAAVISIFVNLKFTGLLYSGIIAAIFYFYWIIKNRKNESFWKLFKNITILFSIVFSVAIFVVGSTSYITNTIEHHNPLYPLIGKDKVDIITEMQPMKFNEINGIQKFTWSLFSKTKNVTYYSGEKPTVKNPIMIYQDEIDELVIPDLRIAGFGPWFAFAICTSIIVFVLLIPILIKNKKVFTYIILFVLAELISIIMVGEGWWARYVPQLFIVPISVIVLTLYLTKYAKRKYILYAFATVLGLIVLVNSWFFVKVDIDSLDTFKSIDSDIYMMQSKPDLKIAKGSLYGYFYNLEDNHVKYTVVDDLAEDKVLYVYSWRLRIENN